MEDYYEVLDTLQKEEKKEGVKMCEVLDRVENRGITNRIEDLKRAVAKTHPLSLSLTYLLNSLQLVITESGI